jgi:hypothetical protein
MLTARIIILLALFPSSVLLAASDTLVNYFSRCSCGFTEVAVAETLQVGELKCDCPHFQLSDVKVACESKKMKTEDSLNCIKSSVELKSMPGMKEKKQAERDRIFDEIKNEVLEN